MGKYFGTDGFRGEANVSLTADHAFKIGKFLGYYYSRNNKNCRVVIGKDTRRSSYMFEYAIAAGITSTGADAYLLHVTSTPSISYVVRTEQFDVGVMISASHNVYYDNGIKLFSANGEKLEESVTDMIEDYLDGKMPEIPYATKANIGRTVDYFAGRNRYIGYLISIPMNSFKGKKVALDLANGSAFQIAKSVFDALGAETHVINNNPNGSNINDNAGSTHIEGLKKYVIENGMDIGFAYDGDADRCLAVDEKGDVVDGDKIMYICAKSMKEEDKLKKDTVVTTVMSNLGLYKAFDKIGIKYVKTAVGDKNVQACLSENDYSFGGEQSGHIIFSKHANTGDGVLTSLKIMDVVINKKTTLSELAKDVELYPQLLKNVNVNDKTKCIEDKDVKEIIKRVENELGEDGRVLFRASGTENVVRIMVEANSLNICKEKIKIIEDEIIRKGYAI
ncbi:MAG: phosphoglucosamine mutase [Lachnospiraceae bacterium]|nr:phosphoglucosamine mutase [Lachnospiraceae bacterium]